MWCGALWRTSQGSIATASVRAAGASAVLPHPCYAILTAIGHAAAKLSVDITCRINPPISPTAECSTVLYVLLPAALNPKEPEVFTYAVEYIKVRSWGIMAAMLGFVASGSYRGIKDTGTPLKAAMIAAATNLVLTPLLIIGECGVSQGVPACVGRDSVRFCMVLLLRQLCVDTSLLCLIELRPAMC